MNLVRRNWRIKVEIAEIVKKKETLEDEISKFITDALMRFTKETGIEPEYVNIHIDKFFELGKKEAAILLVSSRIKITL